MLERAYDRNFFSVSQGKAVCLLPGIKLQALTEILRLRCTVFSPQSGRETKDFGDSRIVIKHSFRWDISDIFKDFPSITRSIHPKDRGAAGVSPYEPQQDADRSALARAVGTDKAEKFTFADCQAEVSDAPGFPVIFRQTVSFNDVHMYSFQTFTDQCLKQCQSPRFLSVGTII